MISISPPHNFTIAMIFRFFGKPDSTKFSPEWLLLIDATINAIIMNWSQVLPDYLAKTIIEYRRKRSSSIRVYSLFLMNSFVMDAICFSYKFPNMGWKWTVQNLLSIHMYLKILLESQFHPHFYKICQRFMLAIHKEV